MGFRLSREGGQIQDTDLDIHVDVYEYQVIYAEVCS
jgi:hypothetical protein